MFQKLTVLGLLSLFALNSALAKIPSVLLCLSDNFEVHLVLEEADDHHCGEAHEKALSESVTCHKIEDACTDLKLEGGAFIPAIFNNTQTLGLPSFAYVEQDRQLPSENLIRIVSKLRATACGPPYSACWLTDSYIRKIVIQV